MRFKILSFVACLLCLCTVLCACTNSGEPQPDIKELGFYEEISDVPEFDGEYPFVYINGGEPEFNDEELVTTSYESYSPLDSLGRCGEANAVVGIDIMPTEERGSIGSVKPTGWHTVKYDNVDGKYLYNRCHLIGYQLTGENANECNLITGTRFMNTEGMLPFENEIADYVRETENHVAYRVTPIFKGDNLLASGVLMQAQSVEDGGDGVSFNVYVYNAQPDIEIDYATGESHLKAAAEAESDTQSVDGAAVEYVVNTNSKKIHLATCSGVKDISGHNYGTFKGDINRLLDEGYTRCKRCKP